MPLTYAERAQLCSNPTAKKLFSLMDSKRTNLALSLDVTHKKDLMQFIEQLGNEICVLKTHIDILADFDDSIIKDLSAAANHYQFLIFEDRKFADIGRTVHLQYSQGIYRIADWAHITNAHILPGSGIIEGLQQTGLAKGNGLLLLAEMSSRGNLLTTEYTHAATTMAKEYADFVIGFIAQKKLINDPRFIHLTPGVNLVNSGDELGQQYTTPQQAIHRGADVIIVGRGILKAHEPLKEAKLYRQAGWEAYQQQFV